MPRGRPRKNQDILMKSAEMIGWAIGGIEREIVATRERLTALTAQANALRAKLPSSARGAITAAPEGDATTPAMGNGRRRRRRTMSPEARKRISEMMTKKWAERRAASGSAAQGGRKRGRKRVMSAEARKRISDAQKKRWAEQRKAAK